MSRKLLKASENVNLIEQKIKELLNELNSKDCKLSLDKKAYILSNLALRQFDIEEYKGNVVDYKPKVDEGSGFEVKFEDSGGIEYPKMPKAKKELKIHGKSGIKIPRIKSFNRKAKYEA
jgi:hypothetical protein